MVKKIDVNEYNTIEEIDRKVEELKEELAKEKGMLVSKTKTVNSAKKKILRKTIAKLLTKKNKLANKNLKRKVIEKINKNKIKTKSKTKTKTRIKPKSKSKSKK